MFACIYIKIEAGEKKTKPFHTMSFDLHYQWKIEILMGPKKISRSLNLQTEILDLPTVS